MKLKPWPNTIDCWIIVNDRSILLEEYARRMCALEETHVGDVRKMLLKPGD